MTSSAEIFCPKCTLPLESKNGDYFCIKCNKTYPNYDGIISFLDKIVKKEEPYKSYFTELSAIEGKHFWFRSRNNLILNFIKKFCRKNKLHDHKMLEIGCGNGNVLCNLIKNGINCQGGDLFLEYLINCRKKAKTPLYQIDALSLPFRDYFDIIGMFDVIEHIEKDKKALEEAYNALKPAGKAIITVPANKKLWGRFDKIASHKRRYSRSELTGKLISAGFSIEKISYFVFLLFPFLLLFRYINNKRYKFLSDNEFLKKEVRIIPGLNILFLWILGIERILIHFFNFPLGSSLIAVVSKTKNES